MAYNLVHPSSPANMHVFIFVMGGGVGAPRIPGLVPGRPSIVIEPAGPHTGFKTNPQTGRVTGYTEYDAVGNPVKRFRGEGGPHAGVEPPFVLEPKPGKGPGSPPKVARPPRPEELPLGY